MISFPFGLRLGHILSKRGIFMENETMYKAFHLLHRLGITANYSGYFYTAYGVCLVEKQPDRLLLVTKWLYPDIARQYETTWQCVERSIRTVIGLAWKRNPQFLNTLAGYPLESKPSVGEFISFLTFHLCEGKAA